MSPFSSLVRWLKSPDPHSERQHRRAAPGLPLAMKNAGTLVKRGGQCSLLLGVSEVVTALVLSHLPEASLRHHLTSGVLVTVSVSGVPFHKSPPRTSGPESLNSPGPQPVSQVSLSRHFGPLLSLFVFLMALLKYNLTSHETYFFQVYNIMNFQ